MKRPRVLHIGKFYPPHKGGMETHVQQLCRSLADRADINVIVANDDLRSSHELDGNIRVHRVGTLAMVASAPMCPGLALAIRRTPADIVHLHSPNPTAVLSYFASQHSGKLIVTHHSDIVRQRLLRLGFEPWLRRLMSRAQAITCFSPNYLETSPILSRHRNKCHVISHGINPADFKQTDESEVARIRQRFGNNIVLGVGRLVYYKGFDYLIRAVAGTDATLLIIGTGPLEQRLQQIARDCGVRDRVHFLGEVPDVVPYYHAARVFALPSIARSEAFGIVQVEAMACGTPVVNTRLDSGVPFVSLHDESGLTVPPTDAFALERAITRLLHDDALRQRLSFGARERVRKHFTLANMADRTFELYEQVLAPKTSTLWETEKEKAAVAHA